jgi:hypothetical protein
MWAASGSVVLGWGLGICISDQVPGDAEALHPSVHLLACTILELPDLCANLQGGEGDRPGQPAVSGATGASRMVDSHSKGKDLVAWANQVTGEAEERYL